MLFVVGGLAAVPADALHDPPHPGTIYLLPLLAVVSGAVCYLLAGRIRADWLPLVTFIATLEIAITVALADRDFAYYYTFVVIYAAYVFSNRASIALQVGAAAVAAFTPVLYDEDTRDALSEAFILIPSLVIVAAVVAYLRERLEASEATYRELSRQDPLTGVGNYRVLRERLNAEVSRHRRTGRPLALLVCDLDDFKRVNETNGHLEGDRILREVGRVLADSVRAHDIVARQGGDEFSVVAPETGESEADELARRIRSALAEIRIDGLSLGVSFGCAIYPQNGETAEALLACADDRLLELKSDGRAGAKAAAAAKG